MDNTETSYFYVLPTEIQYKILSYLSYDELSQKRHVCKLFDQMCKNELNSGFQRVGKLRTRIQKHVKARLPRRESERRVHKLSRHADLLAAIETRISLLSMTYSKYVELNLCCFIPGKVLDELFSVLHIIDVTDNPPPCSTLLQELRDISSMAMEHFDEVVAPGLKPVKPGFAMPSFVLQPTRLPDDRYMPVPDMKTPKPPDQGNMNIQEQVNQIRQSICNCLSAVKKRGNAMTNCVKICKQKMTEIDQKLLEKDKVIASQNHKIQGLETKVNNISRIVMEMEQKYAKLAGSTAEKSPKLQTPLYTMSSMNSALDDKNRKDSLDSESSGYNSQFDSSSIDMTPNMDRTKSDGKSTDETPSKCSKRNHEGIKTQNLDESPFLPVAKRLRSKQY